MAEPTKERAVRIVLIPEVLYKKLERIAKKTDVSVMGIACRALIEYLDRETPPRLKNRAPRMK